LIRRKSKDNKKIKNAKRHEFNGIKFRSGLELHCYKQLIVTDIKDFKYEEVKFTLLDKFEYNKESLEPSKKSFKEANNKIRAITYLPDFTCIREDRTGWIIECKGFSRANDINRWKYFKDHLIRNGYKLDLYLPNNQGAVNLSIKNIKEKYYG
jgi:methionyl-tRNA formyltransferase